MLPRKTTWVLLHGITEIIGITGLPGSRQKWARGLWLIVTSVWILEDHVSAGDGAQAQMPADDLIWPRNSVGSSTLFGSPANGRYQLWSPTWTSKQVSSPVKLLSIAFSSAPVESLSTDATQLRNTLCGVPRQESKSVHTPNWWTQPPSLSDQDAQIVISGSLGAQSRILPGLRAQLTAPPNEKAQP